MGIMTETVLSSRLELRDQPGSRRFPVSLHRDRRHTEHFCHFVFLQTAEETHLHDPSSARICCRESHQRRIKREDLLIPCQRTLTVHVRQADPLPLTCSFACESGAGVIDEDSSHGLGRNREEVRPVRVRKWLFAKQANAEFVDERIRLERVVRTLALQKTCGNHPELRVCCLDHPLPGVLVAVPHERKPESELRRFVHLRVQSGGE